MDYVKLAQNAIKGIPNIKNAKPVTKLLFGLVATTGIGAAAKGGKSFQSSQSIRKSAERRAHDSREKLQSIEFETEAVAQNYGLQQSRVYNDSIIRFANWLEKNQKQVKLLDHEIVEGIEVQIPDIPKYVSNINAVSTSVVGLLSAAGASVAAPAVALWGVSAFAAAGTGAPIAGLSGIAATNATLAALGGGTLAAGGGGMAAGAAVLGITATLPTLLIGGFTLSILGEKSKTNAFEYSSTVDLEIERSGQTQDFLRAIQKRIEEMDEVLTRTASHTSEAIDVLESLEFDANTHASEFLRAFQLVTAVKEILNTPVLDPESGELSTSSIKILRKFA